MVNDKARGAARRLTDIFSLDVVDFYFVIAAALGIPGGKGAGLFKHPIRKLFSFCLYNDV